MKESSKSVLRRVHDSRFATRYLVGEGIDIGAGSDPISLYSEIFPLMGFVREWDLQEGMPSCCRALPTNPLILFILAIVLSICAIRWLPCRTGSGCCARTVTSFSLFRDFLLALAESQTTEVCFVRRECCNYLVMSFRQEKNSGRICNG